MTFAKLYWQITDDLALTATEKAACTSINAAMAVGRYRKLTAEQVTQRGLRTRIYLRHPIERFASVFAYFAPNSNYPVQPSRASYILERHPTIQQFTDAVLDGGIENEHWLPQLDQHELPIDEVFTLDNIDQHWPVPEKLGHYNVGLRKKPVITYRLKELEAYYQTDLEKWSEAHESGQ